MIDTRIRDLLLANRKTDKEFRQLVASSPHRMCDVEQAFLEVQDYAVLEKVIERSSLLNLPLVGYAMDVMQALRDVEAAREGLPAG